MKLLLKTTETSNKSGRHSVRGQALKSGPEREAEIVIDTEWFNDKTDPVAPPRSRPVLKDIAAAAGVSTMTVSNVLRPKKAGHRVLYLEETEKRVLAAAKKLGYVPNRVARAMRTRQTGVVGFVAANSTRDGSKVENYGVHPFLVGLSHVLAPAGRHVALVELNELELQKGGKLPGALREQLFDGLVIHYGLSRSAGNLAEEFEVPLIYWDSGIFLKENCVYRDEFAVGEKVTARLLELGHRRIVFAVGQGNNWRDYQKGECSHYSFASRYEGYVAAMEKKKLKPAILEGYDPKRLAVQLERGRATAVVVASGYMPILRAISLLGKRMPEDISVLACDVEASVVDRGEMAGGAFYNRHEVGQTVARLLLSRLEANGAPAPSFVIPFELTDGSTAAPPPL